MNLFLKNNSLHNVNIMIILSLVSNQLSHDSLLGFSKIAEIL